MTGTKTRSQSTKPAKKKPNRQSGDQKVGTKKTSKASSSKSGTVHPKISERRSGIAEEKAQDKKNRSRRRSQTVFTLGFISMVAVIALTLLESPLFKISEVTAAGHSRVATAEIIAAAGITPGGQLSDVDTSGAEAAVVASSAWIKSAEVDRSWTGEVTIYVIERTPVLAVPVRSDPEKLMLIDETGRQIEAVTEVPAQTVVVQGLTVTGTPGQPSGVEILRAAAVVEGLSDSVEAMTRGIEVENGLVRLLLDDGAKITVGDQTLLEDKMIAVETLFARVDMRCLHEIDVRVPAAPTVTRKTRDGQPRAIVDDLGQCV